MYKSYNSIPAASSSENEFELTESSSELSSAAASAASLVAYFDTYSKYQNSLCTFDLLFIRTWISHEQSCGLSI
jgi:hypothetical protein